MCGNSFKYKLYRNKVSDLIRISKKLYFHSFFNYSIKNIRKTWEGINRIINIKKKHKSISALKDPSTNTLETDPSKLPNIINRHFASVGSKLASKVPQHHKHFTDYLVHIDQFIIQFAVWLSCRSFHQSYYFRFTLYYTNEHG